jgi:hypothetical protein
MNVKCCLNDEHDSTITEDRANAAFRRSVGLGAQSLTGRAIPADQTVWKRRLRAASKAPLREFQDKKIRARGADFLGGFAPVSWSGAYSAAGGGT